MDDNNLTMSDSPFKSKLFDPANENLHIHIHRISYTQREFYKLKIDIPKLLLSTQIKNKIKQKFSQKSCIKYLLNFFPFILILKGYTLKDFIADLISGITVGIMHIPQGLAYGMLANIDPIYGLYTSFFPVLVYFFFGTSRHISIGTFAIVSLMIGTVVDNSDAIPIYLYNTTNEFIQMQVNMSEINSTSNISDSADILKKTDFNEMKKIYIVVTLTFISGIFQILIGLLNFGFVTVYLSEPLTRALTFGAGLHVLASQLKHAFGYSTGGRTSSPFKLIHIFSAFISNLSKTNVAALVMTIICIIIIYALQKWISPLVKRIIKIPLPVELLMLICCTLISYYLKFSNPSVFNMKVVGNIPQGLPSPMLPYFSMIPYLLKDGIIIALISFTISISMAKEPATKYQYSINPNQELFAYGITNVVSCFFQAYVSTASLSRSLIQESTGGKTQVTGLVSCCIVLLVLFVLGPFFGQLPNCVLAAIILVNLRGIFLQIFDLCIHYKLSKYDMCTWLVTAIFIILFDLDFGLLIGVMFSIFTIVIRTQRTKMKILGNVVETELYEPIEIYSNISTHDSLKIIRFCGPLYYANAERFSCMFQEVINSCNDTSNIQSKNENNKAVRNSTKEMMFEAEDIIIVENILLDCSNISFIDSDGLKALNHVIEETKRKNMDFSLASCSDTLYQNLVKAIDLKKLKTVEFFLTVHDAVILIRTKKKQDISNPNLSKTNLSTTADKA